MTVWVLLQDVAWILSAVIILWMLFDMVRTNRIYGEDFLTSSREGELETAEHDEELREHHVAR